MSDDDLERIRGYLKTHYDCTQCGAVFETDGDTKGETVTCDDCGAEYQGD